MARADVAGDVHHTAHPRHHVQVGYQRARSQTLYSTFNQAIKWSDAATLSNEPIYVSSFFSVGSLPSAFNGITLQVGPSNNDMDSTKPADDDDCPDGPGLTQHYFNVIIIKY